MVYTVAHPAAPSLAAAAVAAALRLEVLLRIIGLVGLAVRVPLGDLGLVARLLQLLLQVQRLDPRGSWQEGQTRHMRHHYCHAESALATPCYSRMEAM